MREVTRCARGMFCANRAQYPSASKLSTERASPSTNHYSFLLAYNRAKSASLLSHVKNWQWKEMQGKTLCGFNWRALFGSLSSITISTAITIRFVTVIMQKKKKVQWMPAWQPGLYLFSIANHNFCLHLLPFTWLSERTSAHHTKR